MVLDNNELGALLEMITERIIFANRTGEIKTLLRKWEIYDFIQEEVVNQSYIDRNAKILVIGEASINNEVMFAICKKYGIAKNRLMIETGYDNAKKFNYKKLQYNEHFCAILAGPMPHSTSNKGEYSSVLNMLENESGYPPVYRLIANEKLKITKYSFEQGVKSMLEKVA